jgi:hypothetical protein
MNRRFRREKVREYKSLLTQESKKLESHRAFIMSLETLPEEDIQLLKDNKYEKNEFVQMYFNLVKEIHTNILSIQTTIAALSQKNK